MILEGRGWAGDPGDPLIGDALGHWRESWINWPLVVAGALEDGLDGFSLLVCQPRHFGQIEMRRGRVLDNAIFQAILRVALFEDAGLEFLQRFLGQDWVVEMLRVRIKSFADRNGHGG